MGFIDNIKKKFQESVNKMAQQPQAEQPTSIADRFKQFLNGTNTMSTMIRSNPVLRQNAVDRFKQFSQRQQEQPQQQEQQQTATQNIQGAERVNLPTKNIGTTANNQSTKATVKFDEQKARETFKKANPNATDEEINNAVARLKANNGQKNLPVQKASTTEEVKQAQKEVPEEIKQQLKDIEAENKNTLGNQFKGVRDTGKNIYEFLKSTPVTRTSGKFTRKCN